MRKYTICYSRQSNEAKKTPDTLTNKYWVTTLF